MRKWYSPLEIAGLPGCPSTDRNIRRKAESENWPCQPRLGKGGGNEYNILSLPIEARAELFNRENIRNGEHNSYHEAEVDEAKHIIALTKGNEQAKGLLESVALLADGSKPRARFIARSTIINLMLQYTENLEISQNEAIAIIVEFYNAGVLKHPNMHIMQKHFKTLSRATILRWKGHWSLGDAPALAGYNGKSNQYKKKSYIDRHPEIRDFIIGAMIDKPQMPKTLLATLIKQKWPASKCGEEALRRWWRKWIKINRSSYTSLVNPDEYKNKYMPAFGDGSANINRPNQKWEFDGTPTDIMLKGGRYNLTAVIDIATRRVKVLVGPTATSAMNTVLIKEALMDWGVPEVAKTDNGSDYVSERILTVFAALGIQQDISAPFSPWQKPHIERFFRTLNHELFPILEGYIGHDVATRSQIESKKAFSERLFEKDKTVELLLTPEELQEKINLWVDNVYHQRKHSALGCSPIEKLAEYRGVIRTIPDRSMLDMLTAEPVQNGVRTVNKSGIKVDNIYYIAAELDVGQKVYVRYDPENVGLVHVYSEDQSEFICQAIAPEYDGVDRNEVAKMAKQARRELIKESRAELKRINRQNKQQFKEALDQYIEKGGDNISALPQPTQEYTTASLDAARAASEEAKKPKERESTVSQKDIDGVVNLLRSEQQEVETDEDRFKRWLALDKREQAGEELCETEVFFKTRFKESNAFKSRYSLWEEFGDVLFK